MAAALLVVATLVLGALVAALLLLLRPGSKRAPSAAPATLAQRKSTSADADPSKPRVRILYGTQTGTAERFAKQLAGELRKKYGESTAVDATDIENYSAQERLAKERLVVFCMATYGDGEPTDNAAEFYSWLLREGEAVSNGDKEPCLQGVHFGVFGLGNKQYEHFNAVGKAVHKALEQMGAVAVVRRGDGDDDGIIDDDFDKWCSELHASLDTDFSLLVGAPQGAAASAAAPPAHVPAYDVVLGSPGEALAEPFPAKGTGRDHHSPLWASVSAVRELHGPGSGRSCVHVEVDLSSGPGLSYVAGDHVGVFARNSPDVVAELAARLGVSQDTPITLKRPGQAKANGGAKANGTAPMANGNGVSAAEGHGGEDSDSELPEPFPGPVALGTALAVFADVWASPSREALAALGTFAADAGEAARLLRLGSGSPEGKAEYSEYVLKPHRSLVEVLREHPSVKPSVGAFFGTIAPRLQPRFYSISSSPRPHPTSVHVTCAVVRDTLPTGREHAGVCSTHLAGLAPGARLPVFIRSSHFRLPASPSTPIVMVGPGTGLAPFRGFIQERSALAGSGTALGPAHLFFGCRNRAHDFIYEAELSEALAAGALSNLHVAFSRDGASKDYVQHHLEREADAVWPLLAEQGGYLYVCGDAKHMARDVHRTLLAVAQRKLGCSGTQAEAWAKELSDSGRYQRDVW